MNIKKIKENTYSITVPKGVRFISQWQDFCLFNYPHILDKQIPGCGFTEFCLTNTQNLVLCSPRKLLLENKFDQHKDDIYYVVNSYERELEIDKDITKNTKLSSHFDDKKDDNIDKRLEYYNWLRLDIEKYIIKRKTQGLPFKIIVTYDSFYLVKGILIDLPITSQDIVFNQIQFVVDEFQSIFTDATFKASTESKFVEVLKGINNICFVSATPMIEEYLRQIDIFKNLPYYELDWEEEDPCRVRKPELNVKVVKSITSISCDIIQSYLNGNYEIKYIKDFNGNIQEIQSKEAVFYVNSVNNICSIIKKVKLLPEQVNILIANTPENQRKLRYKLGSKYKIGHIPLKGEKHKMFTLCTRTVYLGADFYSTNARSFILSDANIETLMVDISLDLPQILGRQRLDENPWKNTAEFYYKPIGSGNIKSKEEFDKAVKKKLESTNSLIIAFNHTPESARIDLLLKYERDISTANYKYDYISVNNIINSDGSCSKSIAINNLVKIAEQRAFDIQQIDYKDRFNVFNTLSNNKIDSGYQDEVIEFLNEYEQLDTLSKKLKFFCEYPCSDEVRDVILNQITEKHFREYITTLGKEGVRSTGYNITKINKKLGIITFNKDSLIEAIYSSFLVGDKVSLVDAKEILKNIYQDCGYKKSSTAADLREYFDLKENIKIKDQNGKWVRGVEIIKKK